MVTSTVTYYSVLNNSAPQLQYTVMAPARSAADIDDHPVADRRHGRAELHKLRDGRAAERAQYAHAASLRARAPRTSVAHPAMAAVKEHRIRWTFVAHVAYANGRGPFRRRAGRRRREAAPRLYARLGARRITRPGARRRIRRRRPRRLRRRCAPLRDAVVATWKQSLG